MSQQSDDHAQILNLLGVYCHVADKGGAEEIAALFWGDGTLDFNGVATGRNEVVAAYERWIKMARDPVIGLRHKISSTSINLASDGRTATGRCYFDADCWVARTGQPIRIVGAYDDQFAKRDGEWRIAHRKIETYQPPSTQPA